MAFSGPYHLADFTLVCSSTPLLIAELLVNEDRETNLRRVFYFIFLNSNKVLPQAMDQIQQGSSSFSSASIWNCKIDK